ncbi:MAG TPA: 6-phosphogluconolactonase [Niabella sp.]|nr:6-phosphogluconolactonase [Niabella sp.]HOZ96205.1 6-phosphogluconolactonase [Niabella sp.]HQW13570.1 6-phosphogluconolactonase [Niabella sp.]HQX18964.1 6-phosphogluconolactonase [Niabella sp.]HQX40469.1 6-phosphogluconolactonase [Niabella sp.]
MKQYKLIWKDAEALSLAAAYYFVEKCNKCISETGRFTVSLSGGSTPKRLYQLLATTSFFKNIDWKNVWLFWGDERFVPHTHEDSNFRMVKEALIDHVKIPKKNVVAMPTKGEARDCAAKYEIMLAEVLGKKMQLDLTLLGMGDDGHTSSLFPGTDVLNEKKKYIKEVWVESKQTYRLSSTYRLINNSKEAMFLVAGSAKAPIVKHIFAKNAKSVYPVQQVELKKGSVIWMLDEAAMDL